MRARRSPASARSLMAGALFLFAALASGCSSRLPDSGTDPSSLRPTVILVSLDGFRWDYLDRFDAPTLERLASGGVRAEKLIPVFPTKTFPNHYSAATGLYPGNHGIISNNIYDPEMDARFSLSNREAVMDPRWWDGEPIWVTAENQGRISATYFWPGSEAPIRGVRPTYWYEFDADVPGEDRVDQVLEWLDLPENERPSVITLYFSDVDGAGHRHGPNAAETGEAVAQVDGYLKRLVAGLEGRAILDDVNLIIISDHGMAETSPDRVIILDEYFDPEEGRIVDRNPVLMMYPPEDTRQQIYEALKRDPHLEVFWKNELPERFHLDHPRTPPLIAIAEAGWVLSSRASYARNSARFHGGAHGYDNLAPSMGGIFVAHGPAFRKGHVSRPFEIIQIYHLMCRILDLEPAPNDGEPNALAAILQNKVK